MSTRRTSYELKRASGETVNLFDAPGVAAAYVAMHQWAFRDGFQIVPTDVPPAASYEIDQAKEAYVVSIGDRPVLAGDSPRLFDSLGEVWWWFGTTYENETVRVTLVDRAQFDKAESSGTAVWALSLNGAALGVYATLDGASRKANTMRLTSPCSWRLLEHSEGRTWRNDATGDFLSVYSMPVQS